MGSVRPLSALSVEDLRARTSMKWSTYGPDVLPAWVAEMDAPLAPSVSAVLADVARTGDLGYPAASGFDDAFRDFAERRWDWRPGFALPVADVMIGVVEALRLVTPPGGAVIVSPPVYPPFHDAVRLAGAEPVRVPLGPDFRLDVDALAEAFRRHAGRATFLLCNPHNPTSYPGTFEELSRIAGLAAEHGVRVVVDEIHAPLADPVSFVPYLRVPGTDDAVVVTSASKAWNLAGIKAALMVAGTAARAELEDLPELVSHGTSQVGERIQAAAWSDGVEWLDDVRADLAVNRELLHTLLAEHLPRARAVVGDGSYLAWLDLRPYALGDDPAAVLLERAGVALGSGPPFGEGRGFARLNYATSPTVLTELLERLGRVL
ncbi:MalY/PatB family protein [Aeromicrobium sp. Root495]|uniref:MalY/PatB family protein n=1 Tax=Aeromicrobium sp. Root495 TaxID=1736550 RepID=UPI003FA4A9D3